MKYRLFTDFIIILHYYKINNYMNLNLKKGEKNGME